MSRRWPRRGGTHPRSTPHPPRFACLAPPLVRTTCAPPPLRPCPHTPLRFLHAQHALRSPGCDRRVRTRGPALATSLRRIALALATHTAHARARLLSQAVTLNSARTAQVPHRGPDAQQQLGRPALPPRAAAAGLPEQGTHRSRDGHRPRRGAAHAHGAAPQSLGAPPQLRARRAQARMSRCSSMHLHELSLRPCLHFMMRVGGAHSARGTTLDSAPASALQEKRKGASDKENQNHQHNQYHFTVNACPPAAVSSSRP